MYSLVPLLLSVFMFYLFNQTGSSLIGFCAVLILGMGTVMAILDLAAFSVKRKLARLKQKGNR